MKMAEVQVVELVRASENSEHTIEMIDNAPVLRLRERLLPLVSLHNLPGLDDVDQSTSGSEGEGKVEGGDDERETFIVVTSVGTHSIGIVVDPVETEKRVAFSVSEFCEAHRISRSLFYELRRNGLGPKEMKVGARRLISHEAAAEWRRRMEVAKG